MRKFEHKTTMIVEAKDEESVSDAIIDTMPQSETEIKELRICDECGEIMMQGYVCEHSTYYYCDNNDSECLHKHYSNEEWTKMCFEDNENYDPDYCYWTQWETIYEED